LKVDPAQERIAAALVEAGADLVAGHHPHVAQATAVVPATGEATGRNGVVAYSLGNFLFDQAFGATRQGLALRVRVDRHGLRGVQALPIQAGPKPRLVDLQAGEDLLERVLPPAYKVTFTCDLASCVASESIELLESGIFEGGQADLTGDGQPEEIRLKEGRLAIFHDGRAAWESPLEWRVLDTAVGDPDGDGRADLAVALLKPDQSGTLRSHPFVIGFRGGRYRPLWGGSAVARPIIELELGDVDADGEMELLILEEGPRGMGRTLSVWRWHGWGFSLQWRSEVGNYQSLVYLPAEGENPPRLGAILR
jgi:poly-gamma-glutamate synthesis protein (capsule biosynthesis protein)